MFVAVIDDDPIFRYVCHNLFKKIEEVEKISIFDDAESAIESWFGTADFHDFPDVIFLDVNMNALSGWDLLDYIHEHFPEGVKPRVFIATSSSLNKEISQAENHPYGVNGYIVKPLTLQKLYAAIEHSDKSFLMIY